MLPKVQKTEPHIEAILNLIGATVSRAREARGWTQKDLALKMGISRQTLSKVERGNPGTSVGTYLALCWFLGIKMEFAHHSPESVNSDTGASYVDIISTDPKTTPTSVHIQRKITLDGNF
ncbi:helix-turn-helix transcriptional regulator [Gluconobacter potus]|uniref:helix-turn-helix transcriptional regulator n=1 Tax=Gluconobacter potus TaxID=2724927 RepID=UPI000783D6B4